MEKSIFEVMADDEKTQVPEFQDDIKSYSNDVGSVDLFDDHEPEKPEKTEKTEKKEVYADDEPETGALLKSEARMSITVLSLFVKKITTAIAQAEGQAAKKYEVTEAEKREFEPVLIEYMEVTGFRPNIHVQFYAALIAIFGVKFFEAYNERIAKRKARRFVKPASATPNPQTSVVVPESEATIYKERSRFSIDKDGFYERDEAGNYIEKANRREKPTQEIEAIIREAKSEGLPEKDINKRVLFYLKNI